MRFARAFVHHVHPLAPMLSRSSFQEFFASGIFEEVVREEGIECLSCSRRLLRRSKILRPFSYFVAREDIFLSIYRASGNLED